MDMEHHLLIIKHRLCKCRWCYLSFSSDLDKMTSPCVSFCPNPGKKSPNFAYKIIDYNKDTYGYEDIFDGDNIEHNQVQYNVTLSMSEVHNVWNGRCYTLCPVEKKNRLCIFIYLNKMAGTDIDVFIHAPGTTVLYYFGVI